MTEPLVPHEMPPPIVLLVEDDQDTRELYRSAFDMEGFWMAEASDADEGFEYAQDVMPDAILTDLGLGKGGNGIEFIRRLKGVAKMQHIPVIAVTGRDPASLAADRELFADVLIKPVYPDVLVGRVRDLLQRPISLRPRRDRRQAGTDDPSATSGATEGSSRGIPDPTVPRPCPRCGGDMEWAERRTTLGVVFDYYRPCPGGCGLFCFDHGGHRFVPLIE